MPEYVGIPIETDPEVLVDNSFEYLKQQIAGWEPAEGNFEVWLLEAAARLAAEVRDIASAVPTSIFKFLGGSIFEITPTGSTNSTGVTTWTMVDDAGYTIPAGTLVGVRVAGDVLEPFQVLTSIVVPPGATQTATGEVTIVALEVGSATSGLSGAVELIDALVYVDEIVLVGTTLGGVDGESDSEYLNRLVEQLQLLAPRPILPRDFSAMAKNVQGVWRALALDGYNPDTSTYNNERYTTIVPVDESGEPVSSHIKSELDDYMEARREVNFIIRIIDPTYTVVDVTYVLVSMPDYDSADVKSRVDQAVMSYLSPANWGVPVVGDPREWHVTDKVRYLEVSQVINNVAGVDYILDLTLGVGGAAQAKNDITLPGPAGMPRPGEIDGIVGDEASNTRLVRRKNETDQARPVTVL